jgi:uncharacterized repeat protein (TIGR02543 family)
MTVRAHWIRIAALVSFVLLLFAVTTVAPPLASASADPTAAIASPASGNTYTVDQVVPTSFSCDDGAGPGIATCLDSNGATSPGTLDTSTPGTFTYTVTATSDDTPSQTGTASISYTVASAPTAAITLPASGHTYAVGQVVPTNFSCSDPTGPGIATCLDSNGAASPGTLTTSTPGNFTYTVTATSSDTQSGTASISYTVAGAPTAVISSPVSGHTYAVGQVVHTGFSCSDPTGPGIATCLDSNGATNPGTLITSAPGDFTYTVTATSSDTQTGTASVSYVVAGAPTAVITSPASGHTYAVGQVVTTGFSCSDPTGPGVATCLDSNGATNPGTLNTSAPGTFTYTVTATSSDTQTGTASVSYTVASASGGGPGGGTAITQTSPTSGATTPTASATFQPVPITVANSTGVVTFTVTSPPDSLTLSGNQVSTTGSLALGVYKISGTDRDTSGDTGTWTYTLTVSNDIIQTSPTAGATTTTDSSAFSPDPITVDNNIGAVTFSTTESSTGLNVSSAGFITTTGPLVQGTYAVSGTDRDTSGDTGTWTYTLTVSKHTVKVIFDANGGKGTMAAELHSAPAALRTNRFRRAGFTFTKWNTAANGSGQSFANGAMYSFKSNATLYAQWRSGKSATHSVTFNANGGTGSMAAEHDNTPTALSNSLFRRAGFTFTKWNTAANGSGQSFANGATYSFKSEATLYAQWKKVPKALPRVVTFAAHGGAGTMAPEQHRTPTTLTRDLFRRTGYTFIHWNTAANGSGVSYANRATYSFAASITLYAEWKKIKKVAPPPPKNTGPTVGPFALGSSTLSPALEVQIQNIADQVKAKGDTQLALLGYGDELTAASERNTALVAKNVALGRTRAEAVATYLEGRLAALGLKGWTISIGAAGSSQYEAALVIATLS